MNKGRLCCAGSPHFLKNACNLGYRLRVAKLSGFDSQKFLHVLQKHMPSATLVSEIETEVMYCLNEESSKLKNTFPALFEDIEQNKKKYRVESAGLSYPTLEDVFLKVGSNSKFHKNGDDESSPTSFDKKLKLCTKSDLLSGTTLLTCQMKALLLKRWLFALRYWSMVVLQLILPSLIIAFAMMVGTKTLKGKVSNLDGNDLSMNANEIYSSEAKAFYAGEGKYYEHYKKVHSKRHQMEVFHFDAATDDDINQKVMEKARTNLPHYERHYLYGLQVNPNNSSFVAWFNIEQHHSMPLAIIALYESLLHYVLPNSTGIELITHFMFQNGSRSAGSNDEKSLTAMLAVFTCVGLLFPIAFSLLSASYILYPIKENACKSKLLQLMTGLGCATFWLMNFLFDLFLHLIATALFFLIILLFDGDHLFLGENNILGK